MRNPGQASDDDDDPAPEPTQWFEDLTGAQGTEAWMQHYYLLQQQQEAGQPAEPQQAAAESPRRRVSDEDVRLIDTAAVAARGRLGKDTIKAYRSTLRSLSKALQPLGLSLASLDGDSLRQYATTLFPRAIGGLGMLERHRQELRKRSSRAGEGSSWPPVDQAASSPVKSVDQDEIWAAADAADQPAPSPQSFNSAEFWAGVDQAGQLPADSFDTANFWQGMPSPYSPAESVNQPSPPTWDQGLGASIFGSTYHQPASFDFGEYVPPNWDDGFRAPIEMLRQLHYHGLLPSQSQQMITIYIRGERCTAMLGPEGRSQILLYRQ
ncbi:hypothetical protein [Mesorhizobium silamurunense]|uniref:hypothetical protein n=1 Tax=Mesorhizobium silamurunense TaxID=499528 RepID=UPI0017853D94|nr:hypothetical protein [Mesorhizobium silamurunense]